MSNIMASIGLSQLNRKNKIFATRQKLAKIYKNILLKDDNIQLLEHDYNKIVPHIFVIRLKKFSKKRRDKVRNFLFKKNVETGIHWKPNHLLNFFKSKKIYKLKNTEYVYNEILTLPLHLDLNKKKINYICSQLKKGVYLFK